MYKKWLCSLALIVGGITTLLAGNYGVAFAIRLGMLLLAAPMYFFLGGIVGYVVLIFVKESSRDSALSYGFSAFQVIGYVWILVKLYLTIDKERSEATAKRNEEVEGRKRKTKEQREKREAKEKEREEAREFEAKYKDVGSRFAALLANADRPLVEILRTVNASQGTFTTISSREFIKADVFRILTVLAAANGSVPEQFAKILGKTTQLEPLTAQEHIDVIRSGNIQVPLGLPPTVALLSHFDQRSGTQFAAEAAGAYWSLILVSSEYCERSMATDTVKAQYYDLLKPYISPSDHVPSSNNEGRNLFNGNCQDCRKYYAVLQIPGDASEQAIETAHKDLRVIYHPDRFQNNERLRQKSEERFQEIEQAYNHIMEHFRTERR